MDKLNKIIKKQEKLYSKLIDTFTDKKQFTLLNKLLDVETKIEKLCNV